MAAVEHTYIGNPRTAISDYRHKIPYCFFTVSFVI
jgi:hypothetical protein